MAVTSEAKQTKLNPIWDDVRFRAQSARGLTYQGSGAISMIPEICNAEGWSKLLLVIDPGVLAAGSADGIIKIVEDAGFEYRIFSKIEPNPLDEDIEKVGIPMCRELDADVVVGIGGGSGMDSAKGIVMVGKSDMTVKEATEKLDEGNPYVKPSWFTYPMIAIPTTCGTGSEVIRNSVITEPNGHKLVTGHDCILPNYAICDPDLLASLPAPAAAASAGDALVQAVESYVSRAATVFSEACGLRAVELIGPVLVEYVRNPADKEAADRVSKGCIFNGYSWNGAFPCQIHGCNHPITEVLHIPHGDTCVMLLPWFVEWNGENAKEKFWKVHNAMYPLAQVTFADFEISDFVDKLKKLNFELNIMDNMTMDEYVKAHGNPDGCSDETCDKIIDMQFDPTMFTFPRKTSVAEMKKALRDVNHGKYIYKPEV
jgi:alcohol dehydrogenase class IV